MLVFATDEHRGHHPTQPQLFSGELHPPREVPARVDAIRAALEGLAVERAPDALELADLRRVHTDPYLTFLESAHRRWLVRTGQTSGEAVPFVRPHPEAPFTEPDDVLAQLGRYSHDTDPILAGTWRAATAAAACAASGARAVLAGEGPAYALCRPPGHHAGPQSYGGYCLLNNAAIAAEVGVSAGARVAVLDVDAHAGNGTQTIFWERADVLAASVHADPKHEYPFFHGYADERGAGSGLGATLNLPLAPGTTWNGYVEALDAASAGVRDHGADLLIVPLGVDTATEDGVLGLDGDDYLRVGERIGRLGLPTLLLQEGGYDLRVIGRNVRAVLTGVAGES